jgi:integrase
MEALSVEECCRFLEVAQKSEWFTLLALALTTGMRPSEYLALRWSDIDWQRGTAEQPASAEQYRSQERHGPSTTRSANAAGGLLSYRILFLKPFRK